MPKHIHNISKLTNIPSDLHLHWITLISATEEERNLETVRSCCMTDPGEVYTTSFLLKIVFIMKQTRGIQQVFPILNFIPRRTKIENCKDIWKFLQSSKFWYFPPDFYCFWYQISYTSYIFNLVDLYPLIYNPFFFPPKFWFFWGKNIKTKQWNEDWKYWVSLILDNQTRF